MPITEVMQRLLRLKEMSDNVEFCATMDAASECLLVLMRYHTCGDCNSCKKKGRCRWEPGWGAQVRTNCPHYDGPERWDPPRSKQLRTEES